MTQGEYYCYKKQRRRKSKRKKQRARLIRKLALSMTVTLFMLGFVITILVKDIKAKHEPQETEIETEQSTYQSENTDTKEYETIEKQPEIDYRQGVSAIYKNAGDPTDPEVYPVSSGLDIPDYMDSSERARMIIETYAEEHGIDISEYPQVVFETFGYDHNHELENYCCKYPELLGTGDPQPLYEYENCDEVPLLIQWDPRWGYLSYGGNTVGFAGCGPTSLSMVALYLTHNPEYTPYYMCEFAIEHGYRIDGQGTDSRLMTEGAAMLGIDGRQFMLDENAIANELQQGHPFIFSMSTGDFTAHGHYIVVTGYEDGYITVNDPNSHYRSSQKWKFTDIQNQISNLWVFYPN